MLQGLLLCLILAFLFWNASIKMLLIIILLLVLIIALYTTPLRRVVGLESDDEAKEFIFVNGSQRCETEGGDEETELEGEQSNETHKTTTT